MSISSEAFAARSELSAGGARVDRGEPGVR